MKLSKILFLSCLILFTFFYLSCSGGKKPKEPQKPIKIGAVFSITGGAAKLGEPEQKTANMVVEQINAAGGINGSPIQLLIEDDQSSPEKTQNAVKKLITSDQVVAIIGPTISGSGFAAAPICEEAGIPLVSCAAAYVQLFMEKDPTKPMYKYVFKTPQNDSDCARVIIQDCVKKGYKKVALITSDSGFGSAGRQVVLKAAKEADITIVADETYPGDATDLTPQLTKIKSKKPQAIINWSIEAAQGLIAGQIKQIKLNAQLYQSHGFGNKRYITEAAEGVLFPAGRLLVVADIDTSDVQYAVLKKFKSDYETKYSEEVSTFAGHAYDALWLLADAIKAQGVGNIRQALEATKGFVGTAGVFNMSSTEHCGLGADAFVLVTVKDGVFRLADKVQPAVAKAK